MTDYSQPNQSFETIKEHGPAHLDDLGLPGGGLAVEVRDRGVCRFDPSVGSHGTKLRGGRTRSVYYVTGHHDPHVVITAWLERNPHVREKLTDHSLHYHFCQYGDDFKEASREILDDLGPGHERTGTDPSGTCPLCGEEYPNTLPRHLPCDEP